MSSVWQTVVGAGLACSMLIVSGGCGSDPAPSSSTGGAEATPTPVTTPVTGPSRELVKGDAVKVPYILWGGDMATFYGNGGTRTTKGSVFDERGLVVDLYDGNDFDTQLAAYKSGSSPYLRGTFRMIGLAAEQLASEPGMAPMVFLQMTWSAGDHLIAREGIEAIDGLKGKTIAIQKGGPHVGMLDDILHTAGLGWTDINVQWADDITGPGSPPELMRSNAAIDAAFAITPDMFGLTGGLETPGTGAEGTVKGARVLVSTSELSHSIADVYAVRKSYWDGHREEVQKFTNAYLASVEQVIDLKNTYESQGSDRYMQLLQMSQDIFGADAIPTLEEDAHGLLSDCAFVGHPGNVAFFTDDRNVHGFADFNKRTQDLAVAEKYATRRVPVLPSPLDWTAPLVMEGLQKTDASRGQRFNAEALLSEVEGLDADGALDSRTLLSFTVNFEPNQTSFESSTYDKEFDRVFDLSARYGKAALVIRGHSDTTLVLRDAVKAGIENGKLRRSGSPGNYSYFLDGKPLELTDRDAMRQAILTSDAFKPVAGLDPRRTMQSALNLSKERAQAVRASLLDHAVAKGVRIDESQIQAQGVGIREPLIARPTNASEAAQNMRVEFRLVRVSAEAMTASDFDF